MVRFAFAIQCLLGTQKNNSLYKDILEHCEESYYAKRKQSIYKTWKGRFVFQTTGHFMLQRGFLKTQDKGLFRYS